MPNALDTPQTLQEQYEQLIDAIPVGIGIADMQGILLYFNDAMLFPGGWSRDDIDVMKNVAFLYFDPQERAQVLGAAARNGFVDDATVRFKKKDGGYYSALMSLRKIQFRGAPAWLAIVQDITKLKDAEENYKSAVEQLQKTKDALLNVMEDLSEDKASLEQESRKNEALLASIGDGVIALDLSGRVLLVNTAALSLLKYTEEDLAGKLFIDSVQTESQDGKVVPAEENIAMRTLRTTEPITESVVYVRKDGTKFNAAVIGTPVFLEDQVSGSILVFRDTTKETQIDKSKTEFISLASHQLRTPLSAINWYLEMLLSGDAGPINADQKKFLEEAYDGGKRMTGLVNALLNVSRIEAGTYMVSPKQVDVVKLAQSVLEDLKQEIGDKKIQVRFESERIPVVSLDPNLMTIILQNLITNAIKYSDEGGSITISLSIQGGSNLFIQISDRGIGIPKNQQSEIFTKLFRADNVRQVVSEGSGLGLYLTRGLIEKSQGKIWFESEEGKGTTFSVLFPLSGVKSLLPG